MAGYGYGPPPPPPSLSASSGHSAYGQPHSYPHHGQSRGGGAGGGRGRGGQFSRGRGDYHGAQGHQVHYDYAAQQYPSHTPAPYPAAHPSAVTYPPHGQQWAPEHGHGPPAPTHPHAPAPISPANYHPNYAPQPYPHAQYAQQPSYGPPQQYGNPYQSSPQPPAPSPWSHHGSPQQGPFAGGRGRGGYNDRGGSKHLGVPSARHGYEHEPMPPVGGNYGQPYHHDPRTSQYPPSQYPYSGPPPPPPAPVRQDSHHGQSHRRGRGGGHRDGGRGRGGHHGNSHHNGEKTRQHQKQGAQGQQGQQGQSNGPSHAVDATKVKTEPPSLGKKKKRKTNTLGLTPGMESDTEDDEGEEKTLVDLIGAETLHITDVAAFLAERRKNFPTKARVEAKKAAELARREEDKAASLEKEADRLRRQLRKVESSIKRKREQGDEGDEMRGSSAEPSDDEKPEVMSSRSDAAAVEAALAAKKADVSRHCKYYSTGGTCGKKGKCRFVHDPEVREAAIKEREANDGRMTIQQRLILNDKEQEDLTILQSIQYLREKGLMESTPKSFASSVKADPGADRDGAMDLDEKPQRPTPSLLPAAPASLPEPPMKREAGSARRNPPPSIIPTANSVSSQGLEHYQSWLLQPYGSSNGKQSMSDDLP
ncbi:hypothetical protein HIM_07623 [Hirsutella minnesotensis 3608]|uniref:C3H1-type domain-containing protein n=1 Tax=Hirsutella minnesotensis 3608 TaxID=1043627 RepID=A0A0F7ZHQ5_9HYPO|nr:hypothetical protein HIM_07623 [Hirsutella minnesotensis 3608]